MLYQEVNPQGLPSLSPTPSRYKRWGWEKRYFLVDQAEHASMDCADQEELVDVLVFAGIRLDI